MNPDGSLMYPTFVETLIAQGVKVGTPEYGMVRTNQTAKKQEGISFMVMSMQTPGITLRRVETLDLGFQHSDHNPVEIEITLP